MGSRIGLSSSSAQVNIDFLAGVSIFLVSFLLVVQLVPNLFIPFQGQPVTLHSVGYRTSVILCEDPGWYNGTVNDSGNLTKSFGHNWEDHPDNVSRLGLAKNKFTANLSTPLMLSDEKIITLAGLYNSSDQDSYDAIQEELGLVTSCRKYDYNISLMRFDGFASSYMNGTPIFQIGSSPQSNIDVEKVERIVSFDISGLFGSTYSKMDSPSTEKKDETISVPVGIAKIYIEDRNSNGTSAETSISVSVSNLTVNKKEIINKKNLKFPIVMDLTDDLEPYYDTNNTLTLDFQFKNILGYYFFSNAGDIVGDKFAAKLVIQVW